MSLSATTATSLVRCKKCGSLVRAKKLERHMSRAHSHTRSSPPSLPRTRQSNNREKASFALIPVGEQISPNKGMIMALERVPVLHAPNGDDYYDMGVTLLRSGELEQAASCFEDVLKVEPGNSDAQHSLEITRRTIRILSGNEQFKASDLDWMGSAANAARDSDMFEIALRVGKKMTELDSGGGALNDLGLTYQCMGEYDQAIEYFDRALQIEPDMPEALAQKALCLMLKEKFDESSALYARVVQVKPDFVQGWYNPAIISLRKKNYEEAIQFLDKAIELNNEYYLAWFAKWQALRGLNREAEAEECLKRAIALNPEYVAQALSGEDMGRHTSNMRAKLKRS